MNKIIHKRLSYAAIGIFVIAIIIGYLIADQAYTQKIMTDFLNDSKHLLDDEGSMRFLPLLLSNLRVSLEMIIVGVVPFAYLPFFFSFANGFLIGITLKFIYFQGYAPGRSFLLGILPHGIFEFVGIFFALAAGVTLCNAVTRRLLKKEGPAIKETLLSCAKIYVLIVVPLFIVAALVECHITPLLWP